MSLSACIRCCPATTRSPWLVYWLRPQYSASTDGWASLACKNNGSTPSPASISTIQARVPTLPTPTTLRAIWTSVNCSSRWLRSDCRVRRYLPSTPRICSYSAPACTSLKTSSTGTIIGGARVSWRPPALPLGRLASRLSACVGQRLRAVLGVGLGQQLPGGLEPFRFQLGPELPDGLLDVQVRIPHVQQRLLRKGEHRGAVTLGRRQDDLAAGFGGEPVVAARH